MTPDSSFYRKQQNQREGAGGWGGVKFAVTKTDVLDQDSTLSLRGRQKPTGHDRPHAPTNPDSGCGVVLDQTRHRAAEAPDVSRVSRSRLAHPGSSVSPQLR